MRLIDADALLDKSVIYDVLIKVQGGVMPDYVRAVSAAKICNAPTIDPVKRGKWRGAYEGFYQCSACRMIGARDPYRFCPDCGAKMEED